MRLWLKIVVPILLVVILTVATCLFVAWRSDRIARIAAEKAIVAGLKELDNPQADQEARLAAEKTRKELREQGFKLDLSEFDFTTSPEMRARATAITNAGVACRGGAEEYELFREDILARPSGSNTALVSWKQSKLPSKSPPPFGGEWRAQNKLHVDSPEDRWPDLRDALEAENEKLDMACQAVLSGPIRFEPIIVPGSIILSHLGYANGLLHVLSIRTVLELHDGNKDKAWTNLLAATRLVTAWKPEPFKMCHLYRFKYVNISQDALWEALQSHDWTDEQLATLQLEWESVDFFKSLPGTANPDLLGMLSECEVERKNFSEDLIGNLGSNGTYMPESPDYVWQWLTDMVVGNINARLYLSRGVYQDEDALMRFFQNHKLVIEQAISKGTWKEMCTMPGVTNSTFFTTKAKSSRMSYPMWNWIWSMNSSDKKTFLARASEAEARRRLIVTAIALERYRLANGAYPQSLDQLVPRFTNARPIDFMDGQPLRYRRTADGQFLLYSVGLDCHDDGGIMRMPNQSPLSPRKNFDLAWPLPAKP